MFYNTIVEHTILFFYSENSSHFSAHFKVKIDINTSLKK